MREVALRVDVEDLEPIVGGVHRVEVQVVWRERERADLAGLEGDERRGTCCSAPARNVSATRKAPRLGLRAVMRGPPSGRYHAGAGGAREKVREAVSLRVQPATDRRREVADLLFR